MANIAAKRGDLILKAEPFVHVLGQNEREKRCDTCFKSPEKLKRCTACLFVRYCGVKCQTADWTVHKEECPCLKRVAPKIPMDSARLMLRLIIKLKRGDQNQSIDLDPGWRTFQDFQSHTDEIKQDRTRAQTFTEMVLTLTDLTRDGYTLPPTPELFEVFGKMTINSFTICNGDMQTLGAGIYLSPSLLDHSCCPNAVATFSGTTLELRALETIQDQTPDKIYISYVEQLATSTERRQQLKEQYYFDCHCPRCLDTELDHLMLSVRCPASNCTGHVGRSTEGELISCGTCGLSTFTAEFRSQVDEVIAYSRDKLEAVTQAKKTQDPRTVLDICEESIGKQRGVLHTHNVFLLRMLDAAFDACIGLGDWKSALEYGLQTLEPYQKLYPPYSPNVGVQLMRIGKLQLYLHQLQPALESLQQAELVLGVTHGSSHSIFQDLTELTNQCMEEMRILGQ